MGATVRRMTSYKLQENETTKIRKTRKGKKESLSFLLLLRALRRFVVIFCSLKAISVAELHRLLMHRI